MSIGWVYPIGILTSYILLLTEYSIREYLRNNGFLAAKFPVITVLLVGLFFIVLGVIQWFRYRNWVYPALGFLIGITTSQVSFIYTGYSEIFRFIYFLSFIVLLLFIVINWNSLYSHERFEINSRRLFRLAAERIFEAGNGFTERPYSAGQVKLTRDELLGFARFLHGKYIARPFYFEKSVSMTFSMNRSLMVTKDPGDVSYVTFDYDGSVKVIISEKDYRDYKEKLSFDQLCYSMGQVFIRFLDYYRNGFESRIVIELKSAR